MAFGDDVYETTISPATGGVLNLNGLPTLSDYFTQNGVEQLFNPERGIILRCIDVETLGNAALLVSKHAASGEVVISRPSVFSSRESQGITIEGQAELVPTEQ